MPRLIIRFDPYNIRDYFFDLSGRTQSVGWCTRRLHENDYLWIDMFQINEEFRSGICSNPPHYGHRFIRLYEIYARNHGCNRIECEPQGSSVGFWERIGFQNIGPWEMTNCYPPRVSDPIYQKIII
jgi:hypothetical protein